MENYTEDVMRQIEEQEQIIAEKNKVIDTYYHDLGKYTYEVNTPNRPAILSDITGRITNTYKEIEEANIKILELKGYRLCPTCHKEVDKDLLYCGNCGTKMPVEIKPVEDGIVCTKCASVMEIGKKFCTCCGARLEYAMAPQAEAEGENQTKTCPTCHKELKINAKFCPGCGSKLD